VRRIAAVVHYLDAVAATGGRRGIRQAPDAQAGESSASADRRMEASAATRPAPLGAGSPHRRADVVALLVLVVAPLASTAALELTGRVVLSGDDLLQNFPLRVLAGELLRHGSLPAWDPYLWSGTPLLAGWNAGAMFPLTWLFAVLDPPAAWTAGIGLTYALSGTGTYLLARRLGCGPLACFCAAAAFSYTGFMSGQVSHIGLVEGTAVLPYLLLGLDGLARRSVPGWRVALAPVLLTAVACGTVVLTGEPRAISTAAIAASIYVLACAWRGRHAPAGLGGTAALLAAAVLLGAALSAVQWLPGMGFLHGSQRGSGASSQFGSGSIPLGELAQLLTLPEALGGDGHLGLGRYVGPINLAEVSVGVGLLALVAAFAYLPVALAPRRRGRRLPAALQTHHRLGVWYALVCAGALLAAGTTTPLGHLLAHVPLYNGERLPGRNAAMLDLALCMLLAVLVDDVLSRRGGPLGVLWGKALGLVPLVASAALALAARLSPRPVLGFFGLAGRGVHGDFFRRQGVYFLVMIAVVAVAAAFVLTAGRRVGRRLLALAVICDLAAAAPAAAFDTVPAGVVAASTPQSAEVAGLASGGRDALFNPRIHSLVTQPRYLTSSGLTDVNVVRHLPSVQGYGSVVDGSYARATGSHGLETLDAAALAGSTFDELDLRLLLTLPIYLDEAIPAYAVVRLAGGPVVLPADGSGGRLRSVAPAPLAAGPWSLAPGASCTFRLPDERNVARVTVVVDTRSGSPPASVEVGVSDGAGTPLQPVGIVGGEAVAVLPAATRGEVVSVRNPARRALVVRAVVADTADPGEQLLLDGALQGDLTASHWRFAGRIGPLVAFVNERASGRAWLQPSGARAPDPAGRSPGSVRVVDEEGVTRSEQDVLHASRPAELVRSETYEPGWVVTLAPLGGGRARTEPARRIGILQGVGVPAGSWRVTWHYAPPLLAAGAWTSAAGAAAAGGLALVGWLGTLGRRRRRPDASLLQPVPLR
jgi:hypothetical protein